MERYSTTHHIFDKQRIKDQLLLWGSKKSPILWLDSNNHKDSYRKFDALLALGEQSSLRCEDTIGAFQALADYQSKVKDWIFGYLSYDLKNDIESLNSANSDYLKFPSLYFFQPQKIFILRGSTLTQSYLPSVAQESVLDFENIKNVDVATVKRSNHLNIKSRFTKEEYIKGVEHMLKHIYRGDIYEANFCQEFYAGGTIDPLTTFRDLNIISRAPFASYLKTKNQYLLCTSPERYLQKTSDKIISQPIKGTARRSEDLIEDRKIAETLQNDEKERSENIMITDLVRNDLSRIASKGSVRVEELCGIYSYKQVHQLVSTISADIASDVPLIDLLKKTFPMGSMTGAPKVSAMKIIEALEHHKRGLYSGSVGYFTPDGDFDFNVVIRSILYDSLMKKISFSVGSAITAKSDPEKEYQECVLKAKAMREVLEH